MASSASLTILSGSSWFGFPNILSVDNQNLCGSDSCNGKRNILIPVIVPLSLALILLIALIFLLKWRRKRKSGMSPLVPENAIHAADITREVLAHSYRDLTSCFEFLQKGIPQAEERDT